MKELNEKIIAWAKERDLDTKGTVEGQSIKTAEEIAELIKGISKDNLDLIKDSIGDVYVTLVIGNMIHKNYDLEKIIKRIGDPAYTEDAYTEDKKGFISLLSSTIENTIEDPYYSRTILWTIKKLMIICKFYNLSFKDCVESAYKEIAERKGKMINGTFVKTEDL